MVGTGDGFWSKGPAWQQQMLHLQGQREQPSQGWQSQVHVEEGQQRHVSSCAGQSAQALDGRQPGHQKPKSPEALHVGP